MVGNRHFFMVAGTWAYLIYKQILSLVISNFWIILKMIY